MLVRLDADAFVRIYPGIGYIENQRTKKYLFVNGTGAEFLRTLSRSAKDCECNAESLHEVFGDSVSTAKLRQDYLSFVESLHLSGFVNTGMTEEQLSDDAWNLKGLQSGPVDKRAEGRIWSKYLGHQIKQVQLDITSLCNESCVHCFITYDLRKRGHMMSSEDAMKLIYDISSAGALGINISGGEPFLNPAIVDILRYCRECDLETSIFSNLTAVSDSQLDALAELNLSNIQTSIYSMDENIHDAITGMKGSFGKTMDKLEKIVSLGIPASISCPVMKLNKDSFPDVYEYGKSLGCATDFSYALIGCLDCRGNNLQNRLSVPETEDCFIKIRNKLGIRNLNKGVTKDELLDMHPCQGGINACSIDSQGNVHICSGARESCGNALEKPFLEIWEESKLLQKVRMTKWKDIPRCRDCSALEYCYPCWARNGNEYSMDMFTPCEYTCETAKINMGLSLD